MSVSRVLCALAACVLLAGCADKTRQADLDHDWPNGTYTVTCDGVVPTGFQATLHDGAASVHSEMPDYQSFDVTLEATASGDLDGDGEPDTVVLLQCHPQPSNGLVEEVQVFDAHDRLIAGLPSPRTLRERTILAPVYN